MQLLRNCTHSLQNVFSHCRMCSLTWNLIKNKLFIPHMSLYVSPCILIHLLRNKGIRERRAFLLQNVFLTTEWRFLVHLHMSLYVSPCILIHLLRNKGIYTWEARSLTTECVPYYRVVFLGTLAYVLMCTGSWRPCPSEPTFTSRCCPPGVESLERERARASTVRGG